jgi:excisionase family DNA binding protein
MGKEFLSPEDVADRLGLHVRTVRGYIRDGRLKAVRIGKQYRITPDDLAQLTGRAGTKRAGGTTQAGGTTPADGALRAGGGPRAEVSAIVEIDDLPAGAAERLATLLVAGAQLSPVRVQAIQDPARARLKVIVIGRPAEAADVLHTIDELLADGSGLLEGPR